MTLTDAAPAKLRRDCPVCGAAAATAELFIDRNIDPSRLSRSSFASRKTPEFMNHRLMRCKGCDLVFADEPPSQGELALAYHQADYDSSQEADAAAATYVGALAPLLARLRQRGGALEIGAGTGVFLQKLVDAGFADVIGVEPSPAAIDAAPAHRRGWLKQGVFEDKDFEPASFDFVCCFMTMEHVRDPDVVARAALALLRPGGAFAVVVHDHRALVNRVLGARSPIIDIQHMQLFSRRSVARLLSEAGFDDVRVKSFANRYRLDYWLRLTPAPAPIKDAAQRLLALTGLGRVAFSANVGNLMAWGVKKA
jgi:SAM-dependent methyltransferase